MTRHKRFLVGVITITTLVVLPWVSVVCARGVYQTPRDFLQETFSGKIPKPKMIWLRDDVKTNVNKIMGRPLNVLRLRYWANANKSAWILDEIGKTEPITTGIVVQNGKIKRVKILIFRETRGWEVRYPFFTDQFKQVSLKSDTRLSKGIDSISGATLSVNAVTKLARLALYLDQVINKSR